MQPTSITQAEQFAHEGLLHIQSINKTPMTARQAVEACHKLTKHHTFIASEQTLIGSRSCSIAVFDDRLYIEPPCGPPNLPGGDTGMIHHITSDVGFEELVKQVEQWAAAYPECQP